jgi:hypothetical protein
MRCVLLLGVAGAAAQLAPNSAYPASIVPWPVAAGSSGYTSAPTLVGTFSGDGTTNPSTSFASSNVGKRRASPPHPRT